MKYLTFSKYKYLILLLIFAFLVRCIPPLLGVIPFGFDHGRDALAVLSMMKTFKPAFIGPWTSIPGLYFGPGWYYLLLPVFILTGGHPVGPVWMMIILALIEIFVAWKYFGKLAALIITCAPLWLILSFGAWNPYPMVLISLIILVYLQIIQKTRKVHLKTAFGLGFFASLGFHFSTAFAIFYIPIIASSIFLRKAKFTLKSLFGGLTAFIIPFVPQIIFELRHGFLETKAILTYITQGREKDALTFEKVKHIIEVTFGEIKIAVLPGIWTPLKTINDMLLWLSILILAFAAVQMIRTKKFPKLWMEILIFTVIPFVGFFFLHFNVWYVLGLIPGWVLLTTYLLRQLHKPLLYIMVCLYIVTPLTLNWRFFTELPSLKENTSLLPIKIATLQLIREKSQGQNFASYHYVPDLYDFPYQYLYFWQGMHGQTLPTEFSYQPNEYIYVTDKQEMLSKYPQTTNPKNVFFIIEQPADKTLYGLWWGNQTHGAVIDTFMVGKNIEVKQANPR